MDQSYAEVYRDLYRNHWWWRARERAILTEIRKLGFVQDGTAQILDVGCGDGLLFDALHPFGEVRGVEADPATLSQDSRWRKQIFQQPFDASFQPSQRFDLILMLDLLEHLEDPEAALRHARCLLKPNGKLIMTVPAFQSLWTSHDDLNHHFIRYSRSSFSRLAAQAGVQLEQLRYLYHWTCPVKLAIRLREYLFRTVAAAPRVPGSVMNAICYGVSRFEQLTLSRWGMPFGSSLLAVGGSSNHLE